MLIVIKQENVQTGGLGIPGHLATQIGQLAQVASQGGQTPSQPRTPSAGGTIWKAADYLLEKELLTFALEHRQVSFQIFWYLYFWSYFDFWVVILKLFLWYPKGFFLVLGALVVSSWDKFQNRGLRGPRVLTHAFLNYVGLHGRIKADRSDEAKISAPKKIRDGNPRYNRSF